MTEYMLYNSKQRRKLICITLLLLLVTNTNTNTKNHLQSQGLHF